jgi:hypothetical protein
MRPINDIRVRVKLSHDPQSRACNITALGGAVVVQAKENGTYEVVQAKVLNSS